MAASCLCQGRGGGRSKCGGEGGEGLRGDGEHRDPVSWRAWGGVRGEDGEDLGVGLEGDQDEFSGGDAAAAWLRISSDESEPTREKR